MTSNIGFPTQGEVIRFVFDALGVMPRKRDDAPSFDETRKKSVQKALQRLAGEEGALSQRMAELVQTLSFLVAGGIEQRESLAIGDTMFDLFDVYTHTLRNEGTFLSKSETIKWFLLDGGALTLPISVAKQLQRHNVAADALIGPADTYWYLPQKTGIEWTWPIENAMRWCYELAGTSIQRFHSPTGANEATRERNYDNAKNWLAGRSLPSWPALLNNFDQSFAGLDSGTAPKGRAFTNAEQSSVRTALFIARATTHVGRLVQKHFGDAVLEEFCERYRVVADCVVDDVQRIRVCVQTILADEALSFADEDALWACISEDYWTQFAERERAVGQALAHGKITFDNAKDIMAQHGRLAALPYRRPDMFTPEHSNPAGFSDAVIDGLALRKSKDLSIARIDGYAALLNERELFDLLPWMIPWQMASYHYRCNQFADAFEHIRLAFEKAQYCAGASQYLLLNQYIELAAKNDRWRDFNRGVEWAKYLGFEVRWLRQKEPTEQNLLFAYEMFKKAVYTD